MTYPDTRERHYLYELTGAGQQNLLTGIEDESGVRYATWGYGAGNRRHELGARGRRRQLHDSPTTRDGTRTVVDPLGTSVTYATKSSPANAATQARTRTAESCGGEYASATFDSSGNFESTTDFNGVETRYEHDTARTLETSRTEAYGTPRERTITTEWHSTFRLPDEITEPGRTTRSSRTTRTATCSRDGDGHGHERERAPGRTPTTSYGQRADEDGPRTDVTDVTTYTYYTCTHGRSSAGSCNTITNALGHVTTYNTYNAHGQPHADHGCERARDDARL